MSDDYKQQVELIKKQCKVAGRKRKSKPNVLVFRSSGTGRVGDLVTFGPPCAHDLRWSCLLLGEAPNRWQGEDPIQRGRHTLYREDLAELCGLTMPAFYRCFVRANLLSRWPGRSGRGSAFPPAEARRRAESVAQHLGSFRSVVLVGRRVARAFGRYKQDWYAWYDDGPRVAVVPHPSRVNRYWNDPANVRAAEAFFRLLAEGILEPLRAESLRRRNLIAAGRDPDKETR